MIDLFVARDVALEALGPRQIGNQVRGFLRQPLVLVGDSQAHTRAMQLFGNGPGNTALVGNTENDRGFSVET